MTDWLFGAAEATLAYLRSQPRPHQNLQRYARAAILPEMQLAPEVVPILPQPGSTSHKNNLAVNFESYRILESIHLRPDILDHASTFTDKNMPTTQRGESDDDPDIGGQITIPAVGYNVPYRAIGKAPDLSRVYDWVLQYPLETVRRMMQLVYPETIDYSLKDTRGRDSKLMRCITWAPAEQTLMDAVDMSKPTVTVFVQAPWILSAKDLEMFTNCYMFPNSRTHRPGQSLRSVHRLWTKIYDVCSHSRSRWFVLTSYWNWVFGTFSEEMSQAWVSPVVTWDSAKPTLMEHLFYWFASATSGQENLPSAWVIPQVPEPIGMQEDVDSIMEQDDGADSSMGSEQDAPVSVALSVSSASEAWTAKSDARSHTPSGNASDDDETMTIMDGQTSKRSGRLTGYKQEQIARWVHLPGLPRAPSPTPSQASWISDTTQASEVSTVRDFAHANTRTGAYMNGRSSLGTPVQTLHGLMMQLNRPTSS